MLLRDRGRTVWHQYERGQLIDQAGAMAQLDAVIDECLRLRRELIRA